MAPGHAPKIPHRKPDNVTSPKCPFSIWMKQKARQLPLVGMPLNWQGHPHVQLQFANSIPSMTHSTYLLIDLFCLCFGVRSVPSLPTRLDSGDAEKMARSCPR